MKDFIKNNKILALILFVLTLFRIYLAVKIPLLIQADAAYDDFLFIKYANNILHGSWLGSFDNVTLAKSPGFSIFIAINALLGLPYSFSIIMIYIVVILIFLKAIKLKISNKYFLTVLYIFLLFSPAMFHIENTQKIYRGGLLISFSLLVIASIIGLYIRRRASKKTMFKWSLLLSFSLSFFWFIKEDSIWILPFVITAIIILIIDYIKNKKIDNLFKRICISILPFFVLIISNVIICTTNYIKYGVYTISDRTGSNFKNFISDIVKIEDKSNKNMDIWITKKMMYKAVNSSKTLKTIKPEIDDMYSNSWALLENGEIPGDIIDWTLKEAIDKAGIYKKGGKYTNDFYGKIHDELQESFENGKLKEKKGVRLSSMAPAWGDKEFEYLKEITPKSLLMHVTYSENQTGIYKATGLQENIILCNYLTNSSFVWNDVNNSHIGYYKPVITITNKIVLLYQKTGLFISILGLIGIIIMFVKSVIEFINKNFENLTMFLVTLGILLTCFVNLIGVEWFCSWCRDLRHIYNYTCSIVPLIQILEILGIYYLIKIVKSFLRKGDVFYGKKKK